MVRKLSLFLHCLFYPFQSLLPHRRQELMELLEEATEDCQAQPYCEELMEIWMEEFGLEGILLGNVALFLLGLILMIAVDVLLHRYQATGLSAVVSSVSGLYCLIKFRTPRPHVNLLILLFALFWMICGFWWSVAFVFLIYFTNMGARSTRGGSLC